MTRAEKEDLFRVSFEDIIGKRDWTEFQIGLFIGYWNALFGMSCQLSDDGMVTAEVVSAISKKACGLADRFRTVDHFKKAWDGQ